MSRKRVKRMRELMSSTERRKATEAQRTKRKRREYKEARKAGKENMRDNFLDLQFVLYFFSAIFPGFLVSLLFSHSISVFSLPLRRLTPKRQGTPWAL
jgi:hypothetical protein